MMKVLTTICPGAAKALLWRRGALGARMAKCDAEQVKKKTHARGQFIPQEESGVRKRKIQAVDRSSWAEYPRL